MYGQRLKAIRIKNNYSQAEIGQKLGVSDITISRYESETRTPDPTTFAWYSRTFNVSIDWIIGVTDDPTPYEPSAETLKEVERQFNEDIDHEITDEQLAAALPPKIRDGIMALLRMELEKQKNSEDDQNGDTEK